MLFGAPGVGKGTYSKLMDKEYDFKTFSMGDYFRQLTKEESTDPFIVNIKKILREGQLVDDKLVVDMLNMMHGPLTEQFRQTLAAAR